MTIAVGGDTAIETSVLFTVTLKLWIVLLPAASVAVTCSIVVPCGNVDPLGRPCVTATMATPLKASDATGLKVTIAPVADVAFIVMFGRADSVGPVLSTLTVSA